MMSGRGGYAGTCRDIGICGAQGLGAEKKLEAAILFVVQGLGVGRGSKGLMSPGLIL